MAPVAQSQEPHVLMASTPFSANHDTQHHSMFFPRYQTLAASPRRRRIVVLEETGSQHLRAKLPSLAIRLEASAPAPLCLSGVKM